jgi:serine/threonine-protein kinase
MDDNQPLTIRSYQIVRQLGKGGMGAVYEGFNPQLGRRAAIKVLLSQLTNDKEQVARFFNEAKASNLVRHPSLVDVFECGYAENGMAFIIMEYLDGETLRARCKRQGTLGPTSIPIIRQMATALAATHEKNIVHRDLKPDNVMLVADPEVPGGERVKILDFGIAKLLAEAGGEELKVRTKTGTMMGTPTYMSPEQCRGNAAVRQPSDVYSLGAMLFEMYAGQPPFVSDGFGELMAMHLFAPPPTLSSQVPGVPPELDELIGRMLAKDPAQRPLMTQVAEQLLRIPSAGSSQRPRSTPVSTAASPSVPPTTIQTTPQNSLAWQRRRKWIGGSLLLGLLAAGLLMGHLFAPKEPSIRASSGVTVQSKPTAAAPAESRGSRESQTPPVAPTGGETGTDTAKSAASQDSAPPRDSVRKAALQRKKAGVKAAPVPIEKAPEVVKPKFTTTRLD